MIRPPFADSPFSQYGHPVPKTDGACAVVYLQHPDRHVAAAGRDNASRLTAAAHDAQMARIIAHIPILRGKRRLPISILCACTRWAARRRTSAHDPRLRLGPVDS